MFNRKMNYFSVSVVNLFPLKKKEIFFSAGADEKTLRTLLPVRSQLEFTHDGNCFTQNFYRFSSSSN